MTPQSPPAESAPTRKPWWRSPWTWIVSSTALLIAGAMILAYSFFTAPIPVSPPDTSGMSTETAAKQNAVAELELARLRAEARRNTLALGAGLAALAALALAARRQLHHERATTKSQADEKRRQDHLEDEASQRREEERRRQTHLEEDALQRRITDSRIRAVEQLGADTAAVRIGGLHNLERIGQLHPELRQVVLDEVCAYLRRAYTPPGTTTPPPLPARQFEPIGPPPAETTTSDDEGEVRQTAQEILQRHLNPENSDLYWHEHTRLNLRGAHLDTVNFMGCNLNKADFTSATFASRANFVHAAFTGTAVFWNATFTGRADFGAAAFTGTAVFWNATFTGRADFTNVTFTGSADFASTTFTHDADFSDAIFRRGVHFRDAQLQQTLTATSQDLLETLQRGDARLRLDATRYHRLPDGWGLEADPTNSEWGRLIRTRS